MALDNARNELTYVSESEPATEAAKRLPTNYTRAGLVISDTLSLSVNMIPADDKDSGEGTTVIPGRKSGQIQIQGNRPPEGDPGQKIMRDATLDGQLLYFLKSDNTIGHEAVHGTGYAENYEEGSDDESPRTYTVTLNVQGIPTFFTIAT